jgi:hypothetical protein
VVENTYHQPDEGWRAIHRRHDFAHVIASGKERILHHTNPLDFHVKNDIILVESLLGSNKRSHVPEEKRGITEEEASLEGYAVQVGV